MSNFSFGNPTASSAPATAGFFGDTAAQPTGGTFGSIGSQQQPQQQSGGMFRATTQQPQQQSTFNNLGGTQTRGPNILNLNQDPNLSSHRPTSKTQIDLEHLRPTTKYDHLTPALQIEIEAVETHILTQIDECNKLTLALPSIIEANQRVPPDIAFLREKAGELGLALENDAAEIVELRDRVVRRDVAEGRLCWKSVDRLRMPSQYQSRLQGAGGVETVYGGSGLSGWWNNPTISTRTRKGVWAV